MIQLFSLLDRLLYPVRRLAYYFTRILPGLSRITQASVPAQAAIILLLFGLIVTTSVVVIQGVNDGWDTALQKAWTLGGLSIVVPILVYFGWKLLQTPGESPFPDIDEAWQAGVDALRDVGVPLKSVPLFVVLGGGASSRVANIMAAPRLSWLVEGVTSGGAPLAWYATDEAIFLCIQRVGAVATLTDVTEGSGGRFAISSGKQPTKSGGTLDMFGSDGGPGPGDSAEFLPPPSAVMPGRTIDLEQILGGQATPLPGSVPATPTASGLGLAELRKQRDRLAYAYSLLKRTRAPICPMNGMMTLLPLHTVIAAGSNAEIALQQDLAVTADSLQLRCSCFALITDMEREPGFLELVRRVGVATAAAHRIGKGFNHLSAPVKEQILAFAQHVCGVYEDYTYHLFGMPGALERSGNGQLFALMCKIRGRFRKILISTLANGFGVDDSSDSEGSLMFSGCYFAATGPDDSSRGFIRGVIKKLFDEQDDLEWMPGALEKDDRCRTLGNLALAASLACLAGFLILKWSNRLPDDQERVRPAAASAAFDDASLQVIASARWSDGRGKPAILGNLRVF